MLKRLLKVMRDITGSIGQRLKYGFEHDNGIISIPMVLSTVIANQGGKFVTSNTAGHAGLTGSTDTTIFGYIVDAAQTCSATAGGTILSCNINPSAIYRIPINSGTATQAYVGKGMTLQTSSGTQGLQIGTTSTVHVIIVGLDTVNSKWADVKISPTILIGR